MIIRTQFEVDSCDECWFFEVDDYDFKCRLLGDYFCNFNDGYYADFDVHDEICSKCPFKAEIYDEEKDTIDLDAYQDYIRRKNIQKGMGE